MTAVGWLPATAEELFGAAATAEESYSLLTVDVPPTTWTDALRTARDTLGCTYFDWLSAVDEPGTGFRVAAHVVALAPVRRLLLRTTVPHDAPALASAVGVYAGAAWHERETHEMFGVDFAGHPGLDHLLLPDTFEGHPLRKDFVLAARVAKAWPGAKEPGESEHGGPKRRQMLPPGVPDPNEWGPQKGQLPPAPTRPARGAGRAAGAGGRAAGAGARAAGAGERAAGAGERAAGAGERPVRRSRTASEGSASQTPPPGTAGTPDTPDTPGTPDTSNTPDQSPGAPPSGAPRRARSAAEGSASQQPSGPRRSRGASDGSASQRTGATESAGTPDKPSDEPSNGPSASPDPAPGRPTTSPRSPDAPWHHARPAFEEPAGETPADTDADTDDTDTSTDAPTETPQPPTTPTDPATPPAPEDPEGGRQ
ncbi:NADH-quinone oxidoreductase subunit C [Streptomyces sp. NPDC059477]|uniref:NADH-quinone oxidoreductase subunit C n=1 Tax=Streptomyces sp. NPDC059477 TaxID=3346847 RepID=UPI0036A13890